MLAKNKKQILLLSEEQVEKRKYSSSAASVNWERCTLRSSFNGEFYNTFSDGEKAIIKTWEGWPDEEAAEKDVEKNRKVLTVFSLICALMYQISG